VPIATPAEMLEATPHCLLACRGPQGPLLVPTPFWFDGAGLWMTTASTRPHVAALRRDPRCAVYVSSDDETMGVVADGLARVYGSFDAVGVATHAITISAALAALAAKNAGALLGSLQDLGRIPPSWLSRNRVAARVLLGEAAPVPPPQASSGGVAPALPTSIPPAVRRALSGRRLVALATEVDAHLEVGPAVWSDGLVLTTPPSRRLVSGAPATVTVYRGPGGRLTAAAGLSLSGKIGDANRLCASRATWWQGFEEGSVDVAAASNGIVLPD
jgi:hypothetical protein